MECISQERRANMNEDVLKGKWKEIKGGVKEKWGKLTDDDLTQVEGNQEKLLGLFSRSTDMPRTKPSRNTTISSAATRGSNVLPLTTTLSLIHISEPTRLGMISYAVFC